MQDICEGEGEFKDIGQVFVMVYLQHFLFFCKITSFWSFPGSFGNALKCIQTISCFCLGKSCSLCRDLISFLA